MSECRSCGAPIRWAVTDAGNWMPVDARPSNIGNLMLIERGTEPPRAAYLDTLEQNLRREAGKDLHISHFATCPERAAWRRERPHTAPRPAVE